MLKLHHYKQERGCADCGENDPVVLEFDHLRDKVDNVAALVTRWSWKRLLTEIEKCDVVCANCHRRRTHKRKRPSSVDSDIAAL